MVEETPPSRREREIISSIPLERASPSDLPNNKMVQVSSRPEEEDEEEPRNEVEIFKPSSVNDEAYGLLARTMLADPIKQTNPITALNLLETALTNRNVPLAKHYIANLSELIKKDNALTILHNVAKWIHNSDIDQRLNFEPSAPPLVDNEEERNDNWMKEPLNRLRDTILLEIDKNGDYYLKQKEFSDLHYQDVKDITTRDTLLVTNELIVYCSIINWAQAECHRKGLDDEDVNIKTVLRDLIYAPRYGLMSKKDFRTRTVENHKGPDRIGITKEVNEQILHFITQKEKKKKPAEELPYKMSKPRKPINVQAQSQPIKEKVIINCLTCFSAVFD